MTTRPKASAGTSSNTGATNSDGKNLLNRAGTTFRKLPDADKEGLNERKALALMLAQPSMIKRPVLDIGGKLLVGFKPEIYAREVVAGARRAKTSPAR